MAKRVKRVSRKKGGSKLKAAKKYAAQQQDAAAAADASAALVAQQMAEAEGGDPDAQKAKKTRRKGRKGDGGVDGVGDLDDADGELEADSGAETINGVRRRGGGGFGGGDGFDGDQRGREAYEAYLAGNLADDEARFSNLRAQGKEDAFNPELDPRGIEALGQIGAATHLVRLYDHWFQQGLDRTEAISNAATTLGDFFRVENVKKVLAELESKPIRDIYPLEVTLHILETQPERLPGFEAGPLIADEIARKDVHAGHAVQIQMPAQTRFKGFALLGGLRPGYEFFPTPGEKDKYTLLVDTPGTWEFALLAVRTEKLGKIERETNRAVVERFSVEVTEMGKKAS